MTQGQKIIKYIALSFACFLVFTILSSIFSLIYGIFDSKSEKFTNIEIQENIKKLNIDLNSSSLIIKESENFSIETNNKKLKVKQTEGKLKIEEKGLNFGNGQVILNIKKDFVFEDVKINTGVGALEVDNIQTKNLDLDLGAGKTNFKNLISYDTKIDTGVGEFVIENGLLNDLDLDMGIGKTLITSTITGKTKLDTGIGNLTLNIIGNIKDYQFKVNKGIGNVILDGEKLSDDSFIGNGENYIYINSGIGEVKISTN